MKKKQRRETRGAKKQAALILGMHRSGTSGVSKALESLDYYLGDNLMPATQDNPKGYWEDMDVVELNQRILAARGGDWDLPSLVDVRADVGKTKRYDRGQSDILQVNDLVRKKFSRKVRIAVKDPRLSLLLPIWEEALEQQGFEVLRILCLRRPEEVAISLHNRDGFGVEKSYYLWHTYNSASIKNCSEPMLLVSYERLLEAPDLEFKRLSDFLGLGDYVESRSSEMDAFCDEFIDRSLRRSQTTSTGWSFNLPPPFIAGFYTVLEQHASNSYLSSSALDDARRTLADIDSELLNRQEISALRESARSLLARQRQLLSSLAQKESELEQKSEGKNLSQLFVRSGATGGFSEPINRETWSNKRQTLRFDLTVDPETRYLRFDPCVFACVIRFLNITVLCEDGTEERVDAFTSNASLRDGRNLLFEDEDPQIYIDLSRTPRASVIEFDYEVYRLEGVMLLLFEQQTKSLVEAERVAWKEREAQWQSEVSNHQNIADFLRERVRRLEAFVEQKDAVILKKDNQLYQLEMREHDVESLRDDSQRLQVIENSWSFKVGFMLLYVPRQFKDKVVLPVARQALPGSAARSLVSAMWWGLRHPRRTLHLVDLRNVRSLASALRSGGWHAARQKVEQYFKVVGAEDSQPSVEFEASSPSMGGGFIARDETQFVPYRDNDIRQCDIRLIAFYLPQFHPIPENDRWWGKGFTEWSKVSKAQPHFAGHYQPHFPEELGFYDLRVKEVQSRQIELAKNYGIHGFCFHHYWFGGKRLLEKPFNQILNDESLDLPFCLCWANENWTRSWDGKDEDVLIEQQHSPEDDIAFIRDIVPALVDSRYIRIDGRPLLIVYRAEVLPDPHATANRWRAYCRDTDVGELYLVMARSFARDDPRQCGFDAAVEFPPHFAPTRVINDERAILDPDFKGRIYSYPYTATQSQKTVPEEYKVFRTVMPSWDNTARKNSNADIFADASPKPYGEWLASVCRYTQTVAQSDDEKIVFVNAWNEWGEGTHLEPDCNFGYGYLQVTFDVLSQLPREK